MPDSQPAPASGQGVSAARASLRGKLRRQLEQMQPPLKTLAESVLAEGSRIDLIARDPLGTLVVISIADPGRDLEGLGRVLAQRCWVEERIPDWLQIAPELELSSTVHGLLLCRDFQAETIAAARSVQPLVQLTRCRSLEELPGPLLLEPLGVGDPPAAPVAVDSPAPLPQSAAVGLDSGPASRPSEFRSGLTEDDLRLTPEERQEFG